MKRPGRQISVRVLICIIFLLLTLGAIAVNYLLSSVFLEKYYIFYREKELIHDYSVLQAASVEDLLETDDFDLSLRKALRRDNVSLLVMDSDTRTVKVWSADSKLMEDRLYANLFGATPYVDGKGKKQAEDRAVGGADADAAFEEEKKEDWSSDYVITDILEQDASYTIHIVYARSAGMRSMEMWGPLGESSFFLLRSPLEDIRNSAKAATRFYGLVGLGVALVGFLFSWRLSRKIAEPLHQMTEISVRMKELDFSAKYEGESRTELDTLGQSLNELSQKLELTISALRTANNDLQRDLDRRNRQEEMRQEFLSNVTHELKTPIALIRGYAEGLQDGIAEEPESRSYYLDTIIEESDRMNMIVQKVLMLNQLEFGDDAVSIERFDIADMIRNYLESASLLARQAGADLIFTQKDGLFVWGDPFLIQEVFQNYYSNALHHVKPARPSMTDKTNTAGDPAAVFPAKTGLAAEGDGAEEDAAKGFKTDTIKTDTVKTDTVKTDTVKTDTVKTEADNAFEEKVIDIRLDLHGDTVRVTVFNTGDPIPEVALPHIWEKFYKVDKARTRAYGGSGVGLSIVKAVMDLHHRSYGADNYENGVAFWFELDYAGEAG